MPAFSPQYLQGGRAWLGGGLGRSLLGRGGRGQQGARSLRVAVEGKAKGGYRRGGALRGTEDVKERS